VIEEIGALVIDEIGALLAGMTGTLLLEERLLAGITDALLVGAETTGVLDGAETTGVVVYAGGSGDSYWDCADAPVAAAAMATYLYFIVKVRCW
jgi:hypothetical protein